jgi:phenylpropionate dioxygenase-like ring-hydroxylating dioxygenase large terminal subunit
VCASGDLDAGPIRVELLGEALVVVRLGDDVAVFADRCPHRHARLSDGTVVGRELQCPYHGWRFDGGGQCTLVPALGDGSAAATRVRLPAPAVREAFDLVFVALDPRDGDVGGIAPLLDIPEWSAPGITPVWLPPQRVRVGAGQFIDNFLDFAHFPFVHAGTFGSGEDEHVGEYQVERRDGGLRVVYEHVVENHEDPLVATGEHPLVQPRCMEYTFQVPFSARLRLTLPTTGVENTIVAWAVPVTDDETVLQQVLLRNDVADDEHARHTAEYELSVLAEDLAVLEHLPDRTLELDLPAQVHTRADRITVELRRLLAAAIAPDDQPVPSPTDPPDPVLG